MDSIRFTCSRCDKLIDPGYGALALSHDGLVRAMKGYDNARQGGDEEGSEYESSFAAYLENSGQWTALHYDCAEDGELSGYPIELDRLQTYRHLIAWTAHLMEKVWLPHTNWRGILTQFTPEGV